MPFTNSILNLFLRGLTIGLRFILVFGLAKYYSIYDLGVYGLFVTTTTLLIFFLGFDFYSYAHREILATPDRLQPDLIKNKIAFWGISYLIVGPLAGVIFLTGILPSSLIFWFYLILLFEHLAQELYRLFILLGQQVFANILLFIRMAAWVIIVLIYWIVNNFQNLDITIIWMLWSMGVISSVILGFHRLINHYKPFKLSPGIDWQWIKKGIVVSIPFLIGTLAFKVIEFSDRYFIDFFVGKEAVGVYTFYYNFANVLQTVVFTLVIAELYPKLIEYYQNGDSQLFAQASKKFSRQVTLISASSMVVVALCIIPAIEIIDKPEFYDDFAAYIVLIIAVTLLNISFIPHYLLYAKRKDKILMVTTLYGAGVNVLGNLILTRYFGLIGSAFSTLLSYLLMVILKYRYLKSETN